METKIVDLNEAKKMIDDGKVIAFPTDTVYGLGVKYDDAEALERLKISKNRDPLKSIPVMVKDKKQFKQIGVIDENIEKLVDKLTPGALTIICKKQEGLYKHIAEGKDTVAIRIPDSKLVLELLDSPMLVTSANMSGEPSLKKGSDVLKSLGGRIDGIILGDADSDVASTIVDMSKDEVTIIREGKISKLEIMSALENK